MAVVLPAVVEELLSEMAAAMQESARSTGRRLKFLFGSSATQALDLVDRQSITLISSPSGSGRLPGRSLEMGVIHTETPRWKIFSSSL
uniref:Uncharacterized protein n=1 Tax=Aotus nancymaae TaxID=37293 RepID=A0A2K5EL27_AOTNA